MERYVHRSTCESSNSTDARNLAAREVAIKISKILVEFRERFAHGSDSREAPRSSRATCHRVANGRIESCSSCHHQLVVDRAFGRINSFESLPTPRSPGTILIRRRTPFEDNAERFSLGNLSRDFRGDCDLSARSDCTFEFDTLILGIPLYVRTINTGATHHQPAVARFQAGCSRKPPAERQS
jgi:hypothetical protein